MILLENVYNIMKDEGYMIGNIDSTVAAQSPKLASYIDEMRGNLARILNTSIKNIDVKATTTEELGFVGRKEGISSYTVCILERI
jgi:2-C-methyl-D-erythritol 2,4-cyclodiphosphate synthase